MRLFRRSPRTSSTCKSLRRALTRFHSIEALESRTLLSALPLASTSGALSSSGIYGNPSAVSSSVNPAATSSGQSAVAAASPSGTASPSAAVAGNTIDMTAAWLAQQGAGPCQLTASNTTYVLETNVTAPAGAFVVAASGVTLNLNGYTVTYNTSPGDNVDGILINWNLPNVHITDGRLAQGAGDGYQCSGIYSQQGNSLEIDHLTFYYQGDNNEGITQNGGSFANNVSIHDNVFYPAGTKQSSNYLVSSVAVTAGGSGYAVGDFVTLAGGAIVDSQPAEFQVTAVNGTSVAAVSVYNPGNYTTDPALLTTTTANSPSMGTGLTLAVTSHFFPQHYGNFAVIDVSGTGGNVSIANNTIQGTGYLGISFDDGLPLTSTLEITGNTIDMASPVRDGYAINIISPSAAPIGFEVAYNTIDQSSGRGILVEGDLSAASPGPQFGTIHDNTITVTEAEDCGEYYLAPGDSIGICLRFGAGNISVYSNTITAYAGLDAATPQFPTQTGGNCIAYGIKVMGGPTTGTNYAVNNQIYDNTITVSTNNAAYPASGIYADGVSDSLTSIYDNTVTSNSHFVCLTGDDGSGSNFQFVSNNFIEGSNPLGFAAIDASGYALAPLTGNVFLNDSFPAGDSANDVLLAPSCGQNYSIYTEWYANLSVTDENSQPIAGASITAVAGGGGVQTATGTTSNSGNAQLALTQYELYGTTYPHTANYANYTPYTLTISAPGYASATETLNVTQSQNLTFQLAPGAVTLGAVGALSNNATPAFAGTATLASGSPGTVTVNVYSGATASGTPVEVLTAAPSATTGAYSVSASPSLADGTYTAEASLANPAGGAFLSTTTTFTIDTQSPTDPGLAVSPSPANTAPSISSTIDGECNIVAADYFIDTVGGNGTGIALNGAFGSPTVNVSGTLDAATFAALSQGTHTVYVQGEDAAGNWGTVVSTTFVKDTVTPSVTLNAVASPSTNAMPAFSGVGGLATGDSGTVTIDIHSGSSTSGTLLEALTATVNPSTGAYSVTAPSALASGTYTAQADQTDWAGNTGLSAATTFTINALPPAVSRLAVSPSPTNKAPSIAASISGSNNIVAAEYFVDSAGSNGRGIALTAAFGSPTVSVSGTLTSTAFNALSQGTHTIYVNGEDGAGTWGAVVSTTFVKDTVAPGITLNTVPTPNTNGTPTFSGTGGLAAGDSSTVTIDVYSGSSASGTPVLILTTPRNAATGSFSVTAPATMANGTFTAQAVQTDWAGNTGLSTARKFTVSVLPNAPSGLTVTAVSSKSVALSWVDNSTNEQGFLIERSSNGGGTWSQIAKVAANVINYTNTGLKSRTNYEYRVCAYNSAGESGYSNVASAGTTGAVKNASVAATTTQTTTSSPQVSTASPAIAMPPSASSETVVVSPAPVPVATSDGSTGASTVDPVVAAYDAVWQQFAENQFALSVDLAWLGD